MTIRTTEAAVKGILLRDYDKRKAPSLIPFIESASSLVGRVSVCASARGEPLTAEQLELVERWLSAHLYQVSDQGYSSKSTDSASGSFQGQTGMYLESTKYGQTALMMDTSGCLASFAKRAAASCDWLGKAPSVQTDYLDRD